MYCLITELLCIKFNFSWFYTKNRGVHLVKDLSSGNDLPHAGFPIDRSYLLTVFESRLQFL